MLAVGALFVMTIPRRLEAAIGVDTLVIAGDVTAGESRPGGFYFSHSAALA